MLIVPLHHSMRPHGQHRGVETLCPGCGCLMTWGWLDEELADVFGDAMRCDLCGDLLALLPLAPSGGSTGQMLGATGS